MERLDNEPKELNVGLKQHTELENGGGSKTAKVVTSPNRTFANKPDVKDVYEIAGKFKYGGVTKHDIYELLSGSETITINDDDPSYPDTINFKIDEEILDFILPKEVPLASIEHEVGTTNTIVVIKPGLLDGENHYHIYFEVEGTGSHYGCDFVVFPENSAQCIVSKLITIEGSEETLYATMTSSGQVNITVPTVMHPESETTKVFYKRVI